METAANKKWDYPRVVNLIARILGICMSLFHLYTAYTGSLTGTRQTAVHLLFVALLFLLPYEAKNPKYKWPVRISNLLLCSGFSASLLYNIIYNEALMKRMMQVDKVTDLQLVLGLILIVCLLVLTKRTLGAAMPIIAIVFIIYAFTAKYMTGILYYKGMSVRRFVEQMYMMFQGIFGEALNSSATFIVLFCIFGSFLQVSGGGQFFMDLAKSIVGRFRGGPGMMTVFSCALMGTISGSAIANTAATGVFTIPFMRKSGYEKTFAGATVAVAASGAMIMPPVMGAGAFVMSEYMGISYGEICLYALVPAFLYYLAVLVQTYLEARKHNLQGIPKEEIEPLGKVLKRGGHLSIPLFVIIGMLIAGYSATRAGLFGILAVFIVSFFRKESRMTPKKLVEALYGGAKSTVSVAVACACAGIIIGVLRFTGLGLKFTSAIMSISGGNLLVALVLTMVASIILGMGIPPTAVYVMQAALTAPALVQMGLQPIQAHLFVFYFSCMAGITPPVAICAYTAAPMCDSNPAKVGYKAFALALSSFVVPYVFAFGPGILLIGSVGEVIMSIISCILGILLVAIGITGWFGHRMNWILRVLVVVGALLLMFQGTLSDVIGLVIAAVVMVLHFTVFKNRATPANA